ncbi:MAG TPA: sigma 54-interacting transcriptional regulator [Bryobacteraceae bacterium]|nr:sigma 54-interacting transcriptional regulator [Bryobacteraceae bacterium]
MGEIAVDALRGSEVLLTTAWFESIDDPMLLCDRSLVVLAANRAAAQLLQMPAGELLCRKADEFLAPAAPAGPLPSPPAPARLEWRCEFQAPKGDRRTLEVCGVALQDRITGIEGWALSLHQLGAIPAPPEFIGHSAVVQELLEFVSRIAASRATSILLAGESGTGKELIAKRLHALSRRAGAALVPINCAALPESLLESELFGYERGAFTGARDTKEGLLEVADGGTVFLDEIGEMPLPLQAKLLRVLEDHTFRRVGGSRSISVDVRVIGATNADLERAIEERRFRSDLYYRLNGVQIRVPALRERPEDLAELVSYFLDHFNRVHERDIRGVHPGARRLLEGHSWPGNVRELRNVMERAVLVEPSPLITSASLALPNAVNASGRGAAADKPDPKARFSLLSGERELIAAALAETSGNQTRAAALLGIGRFSLRYKMKKLGML